MSGPNPLLDWVARYGPEAGEVGPLLFVQEVLGVETVDRWQIDTLKAFGRGERKISIVACHGPGKGHPVDTVVPTPSGERRWGDLGIGDYLWGPDGKPTRIRSVWRRGVLPVYRVSFNDGTSTVVDGEHLWGVERLRRGSDGADWEYVVVDTAELLRDGLTLRNGLGAVRKRYRLPAHDPVEYASQRVPVDPYLFGVWLGDGDAVGRLTNVDAEIHDAVVAVGGSWRQQADRAPTGRVPGLVAGIRELGAYGSRAHEKSVPQCYKENDVWTRRELLRGLMDTDGTVGKDGSISFCSTSPRLTADVCWLVRSLGGVARIQPTTKAPFYRDRKGNRVDGRSAQNVTVTFADPSWLFGIERKAARCSPPQERYSRRWIESIEPVGEALVNCVQVEHPRMLYLTNDFILTHNTALAAWLVLYMLCCRFPQKTVATAPSRPQLEDALVAEVMKWYNRLPDQIRALYEAKQNRLELISAPDESFFSARTARAESPEAFQGVHSDNVLLIGDEASAIAEAIFKAGQGSMSDEYATTLLLSNATRLSGYFYRSHHQNKQRWFTVKVAAQDSSRVSKAFVSEVAEEWGEDSDEYRVRVLAEFPRQDLNTLISPALVKTARSLGAVSPPNAREVWGLDVARFGDDSTALVRRSRVAVSPLIEQWSKRDLMYSTGRVKALWDDTPLNLRPDEILVDDIGMGGGITDRLQELGLPARGINVQHTDTVSDKYKNLGSEVWFKCLDWLNTKLHGLPGGLECCGRNGTDVCLHDRLAEELCIPRYGYTSSGKRVVESKDSMKKRGYKSPNLADALMLTFASEPASLLHGTGTGKDKWTVPWDQPLKRNIAHV